MAEIIVDDGDELDAVVNLFESEPLSGENDGDVDFLSAHANTPPGCGDPVRRVTFDGDDQAFDLGGTLIRIAHRPSESVGEAVFLVAIEDLYSVLLEMLNSWIGLDRIGSFTSPTASPTRRKLADEDHRSVDAHSVQSRCPPIHADEGPAQNATLQPAC